MGDVLDTPTAPLAITADKAYVSEKVRQQIKDEGALPIIPSRSNASKKAYSHHRKITSAASRIGGASQPAMTSSPENFLAATTLVAALYWIKL